MQHNDSTAAHDSEAGNPTIEPLKTETGPPKHGVYFAYGSNMSTVRLRERMPSCKPLGIATLPGHALRFRKRSTDKFGKCNAFASEGDRNVIGSYSASILPSVPNWTRPKALAAATRTTCKHKPYTNHRV